MLKTLSAGGLLALTILVPSVSFANGSSSKSAVHVRQAAVRVNPGLHLGQLKKPLTDVHISLMGKVTAVNGTTLTVVGNNGSTYTVDAASAKLLRRHNGLMVVSDIQVNDQVFVQGTLTGMVIKAKTLQDFSLQTQNGSFTGTVQSLSSGSFVLQTSNRGSQTVFVSSATKVMRNGAVISLSDLTVGTTVKVEGVWNNTNNNITASKVQVVVKQEQVRLNGTVSSVGVDKLVFTGTDGKSYTAIVGSGAQLAGRSVVSNDWTKVKVGDSIQVWGKMMTGATEVNASFVIDFSL